MGQNFAAHVTVNGMAMTYFAPRPPRCESAESVGFTLFLICRPRRRRAFRLGRDTVDSHRPCLDRFLVFLLPRCPFSDDPSPTATPFVPKGCCLRGCKSNGHERDIGRKIKGGIWLEGHGFLEIVQTATLVPSHRCWSCSTKTSVVHALSSNGT